MTKDEIIKMAKQAGGRFSRNPDKYDVMEITYCGLEAFAKLVAEKATAELRSDVKINQKNLLQKLTRGQE